MSKHENKFVPVTSRGTSQVETSDDGIDAKDFSGIAEKLFNAYASTDKDVKALEAAFTDNLSKRKSRLLEEIRNVAESDECLGMTGEEFDTYLKPSLVQQFTAAEFKAVPSRVSVLKVAFLAFANGIEPVSEKAQGNIQHFVNEEARASLTDMGVLTETGKGRKKSATSEKTKDAMLEAAIILARHGDASLDADVVKTRAAKLKALCTSGNWKLLDKLLDQGLKTARITLNA